MIPRVDPKLIPKNRPEKVVTQQFYGLNRSNAEIKQGEFSSATNLCTDNIPYMSPRPSRETIRTISTPRGMGATEDKLYWVSGTDFYYDNVKKNGSTAMAASDKNMFQFGDKIIIFPDLMYYDITHDTFGLMNPKYESGASQITYKNVSQSVTDGSTVTFSTDRITISTSWNADMTAGNKIKIYGNVAYPENEGYFTIVERVSSTVLRFAASTFTAGTEAASTALTFSVSSITTTGTAFSGFNEGDYVKISGNTTKKLNDKTLEVKGVSSSVLSFDYDDLYPSTGAVTEAITISIPVPAMDYGCSHNNRIWGVKNDTIYVSGIGRYNLFEPFAIDLDTLDYGYAAETDLKGSFTGIASYGGMVVADKRDLRFEIFNENPPYRIKGIIKEGSVSHKAMTEYNGKLYALNDKKGFISYGGGYPTSESNALNETYVSAVCGTDNKKLYCSLYNGSSYKLYVLDQDGQWMQEDTLQVKDFVKMGGYLYALDASGNILKFGSGSESISSSGILDVQTYGSFNKKYLKTVPIRLEVTSGTVTISIKYDNASSFTTLKTISTCSLTTYEIKILPLKRFDHIQLQIAGTGVYKIHEIGTGVIPGGGI